MKSKEKSNKSILKYVLYAILIELGTLFICIALSYNGSLLAYITPFLPMLFLFKNFEKIEWRIISLGLSLVNFIWFISD